MKPRVAHRYVAEIFSDQGAPLCTTELAVDWTPAVEFWQLQSARRGDASAHKQRCDIRPRWNRRRGAPYVAGLEVYTLEAAVAGVTPRHREYIALQYFAAPVRQAVQALVKARQLEDGKSYRWRIYAIGQSDAAESEAPRGLFTVEADHEDERALATKSMSEFLRHATPYGPASTRTRDIRSHATSASISGDLPLFIPRSILTQAADTASAAGTLEAGGVLLGHLWRDSEHADLMLEITAQVPARAALAEDDSLRFTPHTWQAVEAAVRLRNAGERILGWWHSHPLKVWACHTCAPQKRVRCPANRPFFSTLDMEVHRIAFQGAVNVALLLSFQDQPRPRHDFYGWRQGVIASRGCHILED